MNVIIAAHTTSRKTIGSILNIKISIRQMGFETTEE